MYESNSIDRFVSCFIKTKAAIQGESIANATKIEIVSDAQCRVELPVKELELMPPFLADAELLEVMINDLKRLNKYKHPNE